MRFKVVALDAEVFFSRDHKTHDSINPPLLV
jgi:hypothetical protein